MTREFGYSVGNINKMLSKYRLPQFDISQMSGSSASQQLSYLENLRKAMVKTGLSKSKPDAYKEVTVQMSKIRVEAKVIDMSQIEDKLKSGLDNIKQQYDLGIEINADPTMWDLFKNTFKIDSKDIIRTADDLVKALQSK